MCDLMWLRREAFLHCEGAGGRGDKHTTWTQPGRSTFSVKAQKRNMSMYLSCFLLKYIRIYMKSTNSGRLMRCFPSSKQDVSETTTSYILNTPHVCVCVQHEVSCDMRVIDYCQIPSLTSENRFKLALTRNQMYSELMFRRECYQQP